MALVKLEYTDKETVIPAKNLNDIQDAIIALEDGLFTVDNDRNGEVIEITDAANRGFRGLNIYGKTTQDGTPSPEAPVELVSVGNGDGIGVMVSGKNLIPPSKIKQVNEYRNLTGYADDGLLLPAGTYTVSIGEVCNGLYVYAYSDKTSLFEGYNGKSLTFTLEAPKRVWFNFFRTETFSSSSANTIQLEVGNAATAYEPYRGQTLTISIPNGLPGIPVSSGGNYTDANGQQWICDEIDLARGVYVKRINALTPKSAISSYDNYSGTNRVVAVSNDAYSEGNVVGVVMCDSLPAVSANDQYITNESCIAIAYSNVAITIKDITSEAAVIQWLVDNPIKILYALANPIETPLSTEEIAAYAALHSYKDSTTVSNDAGAWMELEYVMDAKKYIDSLAAAPIPRLSSVTLSSSAWVGSNSLYSQVVTINGVTPYSKVDLLPSVEQLAIFHNKDVAFVTENEGGVVTVFAIGDKPTIDYTMQVSIVEVEA